MDLTFLFYFLCVLLPLSLNETISVRKCHVHTFIYSPIHSFILFSQQMCTDYVSGTVLGFVSTMERERHDAWCHRTYTLGAETEHFSRKGKEIILY